MPDYIVKFESRLRHTWSLKLGAQVMKLGARIASACRPEYRVEGGAWAPIGGVKVGIKIDLEKP